MTRCAKERRVFFVEEPIFDAEVPRMDVSRRTGELAVVVPHLPAGLDESQVDTALKLLVDELVENQLSSTYLCWYYTPMALKFTRHLKPAAIVYDCMDELSHFKSAPPALKALEDELFRRADVVFTGGMSLYEHKRQKHSNIHPFPSSIDVAHFGRARARQQEPADQAAIPHPRIGFAGVIDERFDIELIRGIAERRPDWQLVMIGPVVKIDPAMLPRSSNIHYLGGRNYSELPAYLSGWDAGILPFARNEATRFISPTKTPEYLAAGLRVVSTSIRDVVRPYSELDLVSIADDAEGSVAAIDRYVGQSSGERATWLGRVDAFLARTSWDDTFRSMWRHIEAIVEPRRRKVVRPRASVLTPSAGAHAPSALPAAQTG